MPQTRDYFTGRWRRRALVPALILVLLAGCATGKRDGAKQASRTVLLDNAEVLVVETAYPRGGSLPMHTHLWSHVVYVVEGGKIQTTTAGGSASTAELRPGQTFWRGVESHSTRNVGSTTVRIVEIEIKNASVAPRPAEVFPVR